MLERVYGRLRAAVEDSWPMLLALLVFVALRAPIMFGGYLYADDFAFRYWAHTSPLDLEYLFRPYGGHVNPIGLFGQWVLQGVFPGSVAAIMAYSLIWQVAGLAVLWVLVRRLTGQHGSALVAFLIGAFSMFTFEVSVWWAAAIYAGPYIFFLLLSALFLVRALQGESGRWWLWSGLSFCLALLSYSRAFVGLAILFAIAAALPIWPTSEPRSGSRGIRGALRANLKYWAALVSATGAYFVFLLVHAPLPRNPDWQLGRAVGYALRLFFYNIAPAPFGGPWSWLSAEGQNWAGVLVVPEQSSLILFFTVQALLALILAVYLLRRPLLGFLAWCGVISALVVAVAAYARGGFPVASTGYRYTFDLWIPFALLFALVAFRLTGEREAFTPLARRLGSWLGERGGRRVLVTGWVVLFGASSMISHVVPAVRWIQSESKQYVTRGIDTFDAAPDGQDLMSQITPTDLVHPMLMRPFASTEVVFGPVPGSPEFADVADNALFGFDSLGRLERQQVVNALESKPAADWCGYKLGPFQTVIPMNKETIGWVLTAEVSYFADKDIQVEAVAGPKKYLLDLPSGLHKAYFRVDGPIAEFRMRTLGGEFKELGCVDQIVVGTQQAADGMPVYPPPAQKLGRGWGE